MSAAEKEIHDLTHQPYDDGCEICRATCGLIVPHRSLGESSRVIPLLVADYCFVKFKSSPLLRTLLVMRLFPYRLYLACCVPRKGGRTFCRQKDCSVCA